MGSEAEPSAPIEGVAEIWQDCPNCRGRGTVLPAGKTAYAGYAAEQQERAAAAERARQVDLLSIANGLGMGMLQKVRDENEVQQLASKIMCHISRFKDDMEVWKERFQAEKERRKQWRNRLLQRLEEIREASSHAKDCDCLLCLVLRETYSCMSEEKRGGENG